MRRLTDHARNYSEYRSTLRAAQPPCLPFLGIFLTDLTFCLEGNPSHRTSPLDPSLRLINFDRYQVRLQRVRNDTDARPQKLSRIISDLQRFQAPYPLAESPELQLWLSQTLASVPGGDIDRLYRRSLMIEPRAGGDATHALAVASAPVTMMPTGSRVAADLFAWRSNGAPSPLMAPSRSTGVAV